LHEAQDRQSSTSVERELSETYGCKECKHVFHTVDRPRFCPWCGKPWRVVGVTVDGDLLGPFQ
jgi:rubrerythrin